MLFKKLCFSSTCFLLKTHKIYYVADDKCTSFKDDPLPLDDLFSVLDAAAEANRFESFFISALL